ncbi:MAG: hypothetical protein CMK09_02805 [Ponticaulis sp.]|nr:hypothetical protein [Ponticaulis sp.]|tara:strand:+ start:12684 stop:14657 length:1974 start_codon:yes stop_codon:yes gene_type:complete
MQMSWKTSLLTAAMALALTACASNSEQETVVEAGPPPVATPTATPTPTEVSEKPEDSKVSGKVVYETFCAACHENPNDTRSPNLAGLKRLPKEQIELAMAEGGVMYPMAAGLSLEQKTAVIDYLTAEQKPAVASANDWTEAIMCAADNRTVDLGNGEGWTSFGYDENATRNVPAGALGFDKTDMPELEIAWALGFPRTTNVSATPVAIGNTLFVNATGKVAAFDTKDACVKWEFESGFSRSPLHFGEIDGTPTLFYATGRQDVQAVNALTGDSIWKVSGKPKRGKGGSIRSGVTLHEDKIIVPISASGVGGGGDYCCEGHGAVVALNAKDGSWIWEYHTMPEATDNGMVNSKGQKMRGPSGAPIWTQPTVDVKRNRVIVTTGENTSFPPTNTSDAIIALDLDTGEVDWLFQAMENDLWNMHCRGTTETAGPNCPWHWQDGEIGRDFDFGSAAVIAPAMVDGEMKDLVLAGQKSGHLWALDAETGELVWSVRVGEGTPLGGNHWGIAVNDDLAFLTINDGLTYGTSNPMPGVFAFKLGSGEPVWEYNAEPDCDGERGEYVVNCPQKYGFSATPMVAGGAVIAPTLDGKVFVFDADTGEVLREIDTATTIPTINGVEGKGGSIDSHAISAAPGMLLVGSGYASFSQTPGNVLIALKPKE